MGRHVDQLREILRDRGGIRSVYQPVVDLDSGCVVAYEALARGPRGTALEAPDRLFAEARKGGLLEQLDHACRVAALQGAIEHGLLAPLTLFVNVEPEVLDHAPLDDLVALAASAPGELRVVVEITERALAHRPAQLLRTVQRVRELGWGVALDDVGANPLSLAFMPLLRPDVVKLDLRLVQDQPGPAVAQIMNAVNAYAEQSGARLLAEGIEDEQHLRTARALGAQLGQGWLFGRPQPGLTDGYPVGSLHLPPAPVGPDPTTASPFALLPADATLRRAPKRLLIEVSKQLEREAMRLGDTCVVAATFQEARHFTAATAGRYRDLVERAGFVCAIGEDLPSEPVPGLRGASLAASDPVRGEWDVVVLAPHFSAALLARDLGGTGPDADRMFEYVLTYERGTVVAAARALLSRVAPRSTTLAARPDAHRNEVEGRSSPGVAETSTSWSAAGSGRDAAETRTVGEALLHRALDATTSGVTVADMRRPDQPLVYVNQAFERLSGYDAAQVIGRNCRFMQGADTDPRMLEQVRVAIHEQREWHGTLLNYRGPDRTPWWNEIHLAPVVDEDGNLLQYIGVQHDVTERVVAERALAHERDRSRAYLSQIEQLAFTDPLTGFANRRRVEESVEAALWDARLGGHALALMSLDLDGFRAVKEALGHAGGDDLLVAVARRLRQHVRRTDLLARLGGDEFLIALPGLDPRTAQAEVERVGGHLAGDIARPILLSTGSDTGTRSSTSRQTEVRVGTNVGVSVYPDDGETFGELLRLAEQRRYAARHARRAPMT